MCVSKLRLKDSLPFLELKFVNRIKSLYCHKEAWFKSNSSVCFSISLSVHKNPPLTQEKLSLIGINNSFRFCYQYFNNLNEKICLILLCNFNPQSN